MRNGKNIYSVLYAILVCAGLFILGGVNSNFIGTYGWYVMHRVELGTSLGRKMLGAERVESYEDKARIRYNEAMSNPRCKGLADSLRQASSVDFRIHSARPVPTLYRGTITGRGIIKSIRWKMYIPAVISRLSGKDDAMTSAIYSVWDAISLTTNCYEPIDTFTTFEKGGYITTEVFPIVFKDDEGHKHKIYLMYGDKGYFVSSRKELRKCLKEEGIKKFVLEIRDKVAVEKALYYLRNNDRYDDLDIDFNALRQHLSRL